MFYIYTQSTLTAAGIIRVTKTSNGDKRGGSLNSRTLQSLGGRAGSAMWRQREHRAPSRAGKMAPGSSRRLQGKRRELLLACTYTHGTTSSPTLLLAPVDTEGLQLAPLCGSEPPPPLAATSLGQAAILPLPLASAITRRAAPRRAGPGRPPACGVPTPPPTTTHQQQRS